MTRKPRPARTTVVPDRDGSQWVLGSEARMIAAALRAYGADPARAPVPGVTTDAQRRRWLKARSASPRVPAWLLDYAAAILEQIPERKQPLPAHRPRGPLVERVELFAQTGTVAEAAWLVSAMALSGKADAKAIKTFAAKLARAVNRNRNRHVP